MSRRLLHLPYKQGDKFGVELLFKLQGFWIGAYWETREPKTDLPNKVLHIWICLVPCFPIYVKILTKEPRSEGWKEDSRLIVKSAGNKK